MHVCNNKLIIMHVEMNSWIKPSHGCSTRQQNENDHLFFKFTKKHTQLALV